MSPPRVLTIAGSDSGGGAGIQADLKTFLSLGTYGLSVLTALTAQNTTGVSAIHACPPEFVLQQFDSVTSDIQIDAVKMGMLCNEGIVGALAKRLGEWRQSTGPHGGCNVPIVLDPVMVSTSGSLLLSEGAIATLIRDLLPLCTLLTPNLPEARQLLNYAAKFTSHQSATRELDLAKENEETELPQMMAAARNIAQLGPRAVLVKGGHAKLSRLQIDEYLSNRAETASAKVEKMAPTSVPSTSRSPGSRYPQRTKSRPADAHQGRIDNEDELRQLAGVDGAIVTRKGNVTAIRTDQIPFSDALHQRPASPGADDKVVCDVLYQQCEDGTDGTFVLFVKPLLASSATHGTGCTLSSALAASLAQGHSLVRATSIAIKYVQNAIACGIQDLGSGPGPLDHSYPFRPRGLIASPSDLGKGELPLHRSLIANSLDAWTRFVQHPFVLGLGDGSLPRDGFEAELHKRLCRESLGVSETELEHGITESAATLAYTRFVLDTGRSSDVLDLLVAVSPCMVGYAQVGRWLAHHRSATLNQDYVEWIEAYASDDFQQAARKAMQLIEARAARDDLSPDRMRKLQRIWNAACRLEAGMWDEAIDPSLRRPVLEP
ncbi:hypothetical protein L1887_50692 [Cichorium endivia]|nr:hypothetical protein L1887_50692 [Cichorium endivia]